MNLLITFSILAIILPFVMKGWDWVFLTLKYKHLSKFDREWERNEDHSINGWIRIPAWGLAGAVTIIWIGLTCTYYIVDYREMKTKLEQCECVCKERK